MECLSWVRNIPKSMKKWKCTEGQVTRCYSRSHCLTLGMTTVRSQISTKFTRSRSFTQWTSQVRNPLKFLFEQTVFSNSSFQRIMLETSNTSETCFLKEQIRNIWVQRMSRSSCSILGFALVIYNLSRLKHVLHRCVCNSLLPQSPFPHGNSLSELY